MNCSASSFCEWRGERPTSGYGRDLVEWDWRTVELWRAWEAGRRHATGASPKNTMPPLNGWHADNLTDSDRAMLNAEHGPRAIANRAPCSCSQSRSEGS